MGAVRHTENLRLKIRTFRANQLNKFFHNPRYVCFMYILYSLIHLFWAAFYPGQLGITIMGQSISRVLILSLLGSCA